MSDPEHPRPTSAALQAFIAADAGSRALVDQIQRVAPAESTVLISGESGTGKDLIAHLLHYFGPRPEQPIAKVDCAGLPLELLESELFGYERGAFTGAAHTKRGRFELAEQGTLVLDEVTALTLAMQAKLLRVLEDRTFHRLGGTRPIAMQARIVALTNSDLNAAVADRSLREDLFYRLNVVPIHVPPLRERAGDIAPLAEHFLARVAERDSRSLRFDPAALRCLERYSFPGNVRELRNVVERASLATTGDVITVASLPSFVRDPASAPEEKKMSLADIEKNYIAEVLDHTRGRKSQAAAILGISRKNLLEKRKRYKLD